MASRDEIPDEDLLLGTFLGITREMGLELPPSGVPLDDVTPYGQRQHVPVARLQEPMDVMMANNDDQAEQRRALKRAVEAGPRDGDASPKRTKMTNIAYLQTRDPELMPSDARGQDRPVEMPSAVLETTPATFISIRDTATMVPIYAMLYGQLKEVKDALPSADPDGAIFVDDHNDQDNAGEFAGWLEGYFVTAFNELPLPNTLTPTTAAWFVTRMYLRAQLLRLELSFIHRAFYEHMVQSRGQTTLRRLMGVSDAVYEKLHAYFIYYGHMPFELIASTGCYQVMVEQLWNTPVPVGRIEKVLRDEVSRIPPGELRKGRKGGQEVRPSAKGRDEPIEAYRWELAVNPKHQVMRYRASGIVVDTVLNHWSQHPDHYPGTDVFADLADTPPSGLPVWPGMPELRELFYGTSDAWRNRRAREAATAADDDNNNDDDADAQAATVIVDKQGRRRTVVPKGPAEDMPFDLHSKRMQDKVRAAQKQINNQPLVVAKTKGPMAIGMVPDRTKFLYMATVKGVRADTLAPRADELAVSDMALNSRNAIEFIHALLSRMLADAKTPGATPLGNFPLTKAAPMYEIARRMAEELPMYWDLAVRADVARDARVAARKSPFLPYDYLMDIKGMPFQSTTVRAFLGSLLTGFDVTGTTLSGARDVPREEFDWTVHQPQHLHAWRTMVLRPLNDVPLETSRIVIAQFVRFMKGMVVAINEVVDTLVSFQSLDPSLGLGLRNDRINTYAKLPPPDYAALQPETIWFLSLPSVTAGENKLGLGGYWCSDMDYLDVSKLPGGALPDIERLLTHIGLAARYKSFDANPLPPVIPDQEMAVARGRRSEAHRQASIRRTAPVVDQDQDQDRAEEEGAPVAPFDVPHDPTPLPQYEYGGVIFVNDTTEEYRAAHTAASILLTLQ